MSDLDRLMSEAQQEARERQEEGRWDGHYRLSIFGDAVTTDESYDEAVVRIFDGKRKVKFSRCGALACLQAAQFKVGASPPEPYHYDVDLGTTLDRVTVEKFVQCFDAPRRNPAWSP